MILSDRSLRSQIESGRIKIDPYDPDLLQPCSIDMRLGDTFRWELSLGVIDPADPPQKATIVSTGLTILKPGQFLLGATKEYVQIPDDLAGRHRVAVPHNDTTALAATVRTGVSDLKETRPRGDRVVAMGHIQSRGPRRFRARYRGPHGR